jgi:predicted DNA-binding protein (MmcQ/YjbR family)
MARRKQAKPRVSTHPVREVSASDRRLIERVRKICMAFPEANERVSHGEPTWFAGKGKVFAMIDGHHHDSPHLSVWLPQPVDAQEALIGADARRFFKPPYVGGKGWVGVVLDTRPDWAVVAALVRDAYLHVATAKLKSRLEG